MEKIKTGLWVKTSKSNLKYMQGRLELEGKKYNIAVFKNENKLNEKSPDYTLYFEESTGIAPMPERPTNEPKKDLYEDFATEVVITNEDLPF